MGAFTEAGALLVDTFGLRLLSYLTCADEEQVVARLSDGAPLGEAAEGVLLPLTALARQAAASATESGGPVGLHLSVLGLFQASLGTSLGAALRVQAGGDLLAVPAEELEVHLALILRDVYPLLLLPDDPRMPMRPSLSVAAFKHPAREAFERAVAADPDLSAIFPATLASDTAPPVVFRSTGSGGTVQLELLPDLLIGSAWIRARAGGRHDIVSIASELKAVLELVRRAARGEPCEVNVLIAFTGLLPEGVDRIELPYGTLRPIADHERALAPASIEGSLSHSPGDGDTVVVSYAGDLVMESSISYRLAVAKGHADPVAPWPADLRAFDQLEAIIDTTRLAALLTGTSDAPLTLAPTWRMTFDPLSFGPMVSWSDPRSLPGLAPRRLTSDVADRFAAIAAEIARHRRPACDVAVRRTISGLSTRGDPGDALVDLVIAWENLFGSTQGELRFRISAAIAWLLGPDAAARGALQEQVTKIYDTRSAILHGSAPKDEHVQASLATTRDIQLRLMRVLFTERQDLLALKDGAARSKAVILGG